MKNVLRRVLEVPDVHRPYHDKMAWKLLIAAAKQFKPNIIVIHGDFGDFYALSSHSNRDPKKALMLVEELASMNEGLDELDALGAEEKHFQSGNHCLDLQHRCLTKDGWKTVDDVKVGTEIATMGTDGVVEWQPIQCITRRMQLPDEKMYAYHTRGANIVCTDQHQIIGKTGQSDLWKRKAKDCFKSFDILTCAKSGKPDYPLSDVQLRLAAWACTDVHYLPRNDSMVFYQSETGKELDLESALDGCGIVYRKHERIRNITVVAGKTLKKPPRRHFEYSLKVDAGRIVRALTGIDKKGTLPAWVGELSDAQWKTFLDTLTIADGSFAGTSCRIINGQLPICEAIQIAAVTHGQRASISEYRPGQFRVSVTDYTSLRVDKWGPSDLTGVEVWCPTVANGNFLTERSGDVCVTGNCNRLDRYVKDRAPELVELPALSVPALLNLKSRGWKYHPYRKDWRLGKVYRVHDVGLAGRYTPFRALDLYQHSCITAHTHRFGYVVESNAAGESMISATLGWLGDREQLADYLPDVTSRMKWALGFGVGYLDDKSGAYYLVPVPIIKNTCCIEGTVVSV